MIGTLKLRSSLVYRMGMLRGALLERIKASSDLLHDVDKLESLAVDPDMEPEDVESAVDGLEALAGVGTNNGRKRAKHGQEIAPG